MIKSLTSLKKPEPTYKSASANKKVFLLFHTRLCISIGGYFLPLLEKPH